MFRGGSNWGGTFRGEYSGHLLQHLQRLVVFNAENNFFIITGNIILEYGLLLCYLLVFLASYFLIEMASFNKDIEDKISSINADLEDKMGFSDSDSDSCDSEDSFHSISNSNQRDSDSNLLNSSSADSRLQDSSPESKMASESDKFFNSNQFSSRESKNIDNSSSELNEFDERPNLANEESGEPDKVSNFISELNEQCAQGNKIIEDELEFDILCLKSVKNRDEQNETKLEKMCEDLDEEKLKVRMCVSMLVLLTH